MNSWEHKDEWKKYGKDFLVVVSRHSVPMLDEYVGYDSEGPNRWCVYAYIYPKHPHFNKFDGNNIWQEATAAMPLHGGCTYLRRHYNDTQEVVSVQTGCDYNHIYDTIYTRMSTANEAQSIFKDAQNLFDWLTFQHGGDK